MTEEKETTKETKIEDNEKEIGGENKKSSGALVLVKEKYQNAKLFFNKHKEKYLPWYSFAHDVLMFADHLPIAPKFYNYMYMGYQVVESYMELFDRSSPVSPLLKHKLEGTICYEMNSEWVRSLIWKKYGDGANLVYENEEMKTFIVDIEDVKIGWFENTKDKTVSNIFVHPEKKDEFHKIIKELVRSEFPSGRMVLSGKTRKVIVDSSKNKIIKFQKCLELTEEIKEFWEAKENRSILFYGPPGSGKTNLIKAIADELNATILKFGDLDDLEVSFMMEVIRICKPDCIIFDDIDNMSMSSLQKLLEEIEMISSEVKLVMSSANHINELDPALIRPERFDKLIEIKTLDKEVIMKLISGEGPDDEELFELVKEMPIVSINEIMKRIRVLGREKALANIGDITDRLASMNMNNYSLQKHRGYGNIDHLIREMDDDDDLDDDDIEFDEED